MRTEFTDKFGKIIAAVECGNGDFLAELERRVLGTYMPTGEDAGEVVASARVYDDNGLLVMEHGK